MTDGRGALKAANDQEALGILNRILAEEGTADFTPGHVGFAEFILNRLRANGFDIALIRVS